MNRAEMRDYIRRKLGVQPPVDAGIPGAVPGDGPPWQPDPSNALLNQAIEDACKFYNREVGLVDSGGYVTETVTAQTADGPYWIDLRTVGGYPANSIVGIVRAFWNTGSTRTLLTPTSLKAEDRKLRVYRDEAPGTVVQYAVEGYRLALLPANSAAGTLELDLTTTLMGPRHDGEGFTQVPDSYEPCLLDQAIVETCLAMRGDVELQAVSQAYEARTGRNVSQLRRWKNSLTNERYAPGLVPDVRRRRY